MNLLMAELLQVTTALPGGEVVHVRPIVPGDKAVLQDGMHRMSPQSRHYRFFSPVSELTDEQLRYFTEIDYHDHFAFGAFIDDPAHPGIGVARYIRLRDEPGTAEFAVAVVDEWQGRGVGPLLLGAVVLAARHNGFERVVGEVLRDNGPMLRVSDRFGARIEGGDPGEVRAVIEVAAWADDAGGRPWDDLRAVIAAVSPP
jgi:RimJ/RimL family protein N-acetyltransferase